MDLIKLLMKGLEDFPTLPTIYNALNEVMENPNSTTDDAAAIIIRDQAASVKLLRAANSSIYGLRGQIDTISEAIFYIGFEEVKNLILALSVFDIFSKSSVNNHYNIIELWKHSIAVGVITRALGKHLEIKNLENFFVCGILHDIGKILLIRSFPNYYIGSVRYALEKELAIKDAEADFLGITHNVAGELITEKWHLPDTIRNVIRYHSTGFIDDKPDVLTACVHIADITAYLYNFGSPADLIIPEPNVKVWDVLKLPNDTFTTLLPKVLKDYEESLSIFNLN